MSRADAPGHAAPGRAGRRDPDRASRRAAAGGLERRARVADPGLLEEPRGGQRLPCKSSTVVDVADPGLRRTPTSWRWWISQPLSWTMRGLLRNCCYWVGDAMPGTPMGLRVSPRLQVPSDPQVSAARAGATQAPQPSVLMRATVQVAEMTG
jgi:hypothetical protein